MKLVLLLVWDESQWMDFCHQNTGRYHVELDVDQKGAENIPVMFRASGCPPVNKP